MLCVYTYIHTEWNGTQPLKEQNVICSIMYETGDYHTKWSNSGRERQIPYEGVDGAGGSVSDAEQWGVADQVSPTGLLLTSCCVAPFLTGCRPVPVCSPGTGDPCSREYAYSKKRTSSKREVRCKYSRKCHKEKWFGWSEKQQLPRASRENWLPQGLQKRHQHAQDLKPGIKTPIEAHLFIKLA